MEAALALMENAWDGNTDLAKASWNDAVGCMQTQFNRSYKVVTNDEAEPWKGNYVLSFPYKDDNGNIIELYDHVTSIPLVSCTALRPLYDCIIGWEYVRVACLIHAVHARWVKSQLYPRGANRLPAHAQGG